jgi:hypothetical protein
MDDGYFGRFGTGGSTRSIMPFVPAALAGNLGPVAAALRLVFVDPEAGPEVNGVPVTAEAEIPATSGLRLFNIGIAEARCAELWPHGPSPPRPDLPR